MGEFDKTGYVWPKREKFSTPKSESNSLARFYSQTALRRHCSRHWRLSSFSNRSQVDKWRQQLQSIHFPTFVLHLLAGQLPPLLNGIHNLHMAPQTILLQSITSTISSTLPINSWLSCASGAASPGDNSRLSTTILLIRLMFVIV